MIVSDEVNAAILRQKGDTASEIGRRLVGKMTGSLDPVTKQCVYLYTRLVRTRLESYNKSQIIYSETALIQRIYSE